MPSWTDMFRKKAARTGKAAEALEQIFSAYNLQGSWLHFLVFDRNTTVDYSMFKLKYFQS